MALKARQSRPDRALGSESSERRPSPCCDNSQKIALAPGLGYLSGVTRRYPLESLRELRRRERDARADQLAEQLGGVEAAEKRVRMAESARQREQDAHQQVEAAEWSRTLAGITRVADLVRAAEWRRAARERETASAEKVRAADLAVSRERSEAEARRVALSLADADGRILERHFRGWNEERTRVAERASEEEAADGWLGRRSRSGGRGRGP